MKLPQCCEETDTETKNLQTKALNLKHCLLLVNKLKLASVHALNPLKRNLMKRSQAQIYKIKSCNSKHAAPAEMEAMRVI